jgi:RNA polymerase sigma factor (sigma-70 family)
MTSVFWHLRRAVAGPAGDALSDGQLLEQYLCQRDEAAFELLVCRHGPMVLGVCRRMLGNPHDAEDAFQATFLVLVRRASAIWPRDRVGHWLYGVAYRIALKVRGRNDRKLAREKPLNDMAGPATEHRDVGELRAVLDQELSRLPDKYRMPVLLCDLQGRTRQEVAQSLGWPEGTVATRLHQARRRLAKQLARLGLGVTSAALAAALAEVGRAANVPASLVAATAQNARLFAGPAAAVGQISQELGSLTQEVLKTMTLHRIKTIMAALLVLALFGTGFGLALHSALAGPQDQQAPGVGPGKEQGKPGLPTARQATDADRANPNSDKGGPVQADNSSKARTGDKAGPPEKTGKQTAEQKSDRDGTKTIKLDVNIDMILPEKMNASVQLDLNDVPLAAVLDFLRTAYDMNIVFDKEALRENDLDIHVPISLRLKKVPFRVGLRHILRQAGMSYTFDHNILVITTPKARLVRRVYDLDDILGGGAKDKQKLLESFVKIITKTVEPDTWAENGGSGGVEILGEALIISNFPGVHEEIEALLEELHRPSYSRRGSGAGL